MLGILGIHVSAGTAEGWFGPGARSVILSIATLSILPISIIFSVVLFVTNIQGGTAIQQPNAPMAPVAPAPVVPTVLVPVVVPTTPAPAPVATPSTTAKKPVPAGVIEITVEKLVSDLLSTPDKYKRGTVFQVSGVYRSRWVVGTQIYFFLDPTVPASAYFEVEIDSDVEKEPQLFAAFSALKSGDRVVVRGTYSEPGRFIHEEKNYDVVRLEKCSLISSTIGR